MDQRVRGGGPLRPSFSGAARLRTGGMGRRIAHRGAGDSPHIAVMALRLLVLYSILTSALWVLLTSP
jgi:hypothetical protein